MGTGLIFPGQEEVTDRKALFALIGLGGPRQRFLETALHQIVP